MLLFWEYVHSAGGVVFSIPPVDPQINHHHWHVGCMTQEVLFFLFGKIWLVVLASQSRVQWVLICWAGAWQLTNVGGKSKDSSSDISYQISHVKQKSNSRDFTLIWHFDKYGKLPSEHALISRQPAMWNYRSDAFKEILLKKSDTHASHLYSGFSPVTFDMTQWNDLMQWLPVVCT